MLLLLSCSYLPSCFYPFACSNAQNQIPFYSLVLVEVGKPFFSIRYLYDILTKASVVKKKIPILICCNKSDKVTARTKEFIRKQMEKEMYGREFICLYIFCIRFIVFCKLQYPLS
ncbi:hypothetical protein DITRI_Ditri04bG0085800 [Diplodiscus trichospermus]